MHPSQAPVEGEELYPRGPLGRRSFSERAARPQRLPERRAPRLLPPNLRRSRRPGRNLPAGREAALAGDFQCASEAFSRAVESVRPAGEEASADPVIIAFSTELYEGIVRYESMAPPVESEAQEMAARAPMLAPPDSPDATPDALLKARQAVSTDSGTRAYDIPIVVNDSVLRILAVYQNDLHDIIARGLARSGRFVPMIERVFQEEGLPKDLAQVAMVESSFIPRARSPKAACGIWQFIPETGRHYGLTSNGVRGREKRPGEGDARRGPVSPVPVRPLPRLVPRHGRLQRRRREDPPDDGEDRADGLLAARRLGPPEAPDAELRARRHRLHADREEPGPLWLRGRVREAARLRDSPARPPRQPAAPRGRKTGRRSRSFSG